MKPEPGVISAYHRFDVRAYRLTNGKLVGTTVAELEKSFQPRRVFVERIRRGADESSRRIPRPRCRRMTRWPSWDR